MLDKQQKQICRTVGPSLPASLEPLAHCPDVFSTGITLIDVHLDLAQLVPFPYSRGRSTCHQGYSLKGGWWGGEGGWGFSPTQ